MSRVTCQAPPRAFLFLAGDAERTCRGSSGSLCCFLPVSFSFSPRIVTVSRLFRAAFPEPLKRVSAVDDALVLCAVASPGVWTVCSLHDTWESQECARRFPLGVGMLDSGHHGGENAQLSLCFSRCCVYKVLGFSTQDRRDAPESKETHSREDGQPEVLSPTRGSQAHGGQHAQPAGHHGARAAAPELVAAEDTYRGLRKQPHRWCSHARAVAFLTHLVLMLPVTERNHSSFQ